MRRRCAALLVGLGVALSGAGLHAQLQAPSPQTVTTQDSGTACSVAGTCASWTVSTLQTLTLQVTGTFSGTLTFEATADNSTWFAITVTKLSGLTNSTTTTGTGQFAVGNSGLIGVRARATTWSSGSAVVTLTRGAASARNNPSSGGGGGSGTVTDFSVVTANGVSATVADSTTTPAATFTLGAITPTTVNKVTITAPASGSTLTIANGKTLTASNTLTLTGTDSSSVAFGAGGTVQYTTGSPAAFVIASQAAGDILYASSASAWARLAKGTDGQVLTLASGVPSWAAGGSGSFCSGADGNIGYIATNACANENAFNYNASTNSLVITNGTTAYFETLLGMSPGFGTLDGIRVQAPTNSNPGIVLDTKAGGGTAIIEFVDNGTFKLGIAKAAGAAIMDFYGAGSTTPKLHLNSGLYTHNTTDSGNDTVTAIAHVAKAQTVANLPASPVEGMIASVTDSTTATWGATIAGGSTNHVLAYYNGTNWTVAGK